MNYFEVALKKADQVNPAAHQKTQLSFMEVKMVAPFNQQFVTLLNNRLV